MNDITPAHSFIQPMCIDNENNIIVQNIYTFILFMKICKIYILTNLFNKYK